MVTRLLIWVRILDEGLGSVYVGVQIGGMDTAGVKKGSRESRLCSVEVRAVILI